MNSHRVSSIKGVTFLLIRKKKDCKEILTPSLPLRPGMFRVDTYCNEIMHLTFQSSMNTLFSTLINKC